MFATGELVVFLSYLVNNLRGKVESCLAVGVIHEVVKGGDAVDQDSPNDAVDLGVVVDVFRLRVHVFCLS